MERPSLPDPSTRPSARRAGTLVGLAVIAVLLLSGCTPAPAAPIPIPVPPAPDAPLFVSDDAALAAAHETYTAYLAAGNKADSGESNAREDFFKLSMGEAHEEEKRVAKMFDDNGWVGVGVLTFDSMKLNSHGTLDSEAYEIRTRLCLDASESDVLDSTGASVAKPDRPVRLPFEVVLQSSGENHQLLVSESKVWTGQDFC